MKTKHKPRAVEKCKAPAKPAPAKVRKKSGAATAAGEPDHGSLMKPPPKLSAEEEKLWAQFDMAGICYLRMENIRQLKQRNPVQKQMLKEHDELERRMADEPKEVFREAHEALDRGTSLLCRLIRSGHLRERYHTADGKVFLDTDSSLDCLISRTHHLNSQLLRLAAARRDEACSHLFFEATRFAREFIRLAQAHPEDFTSSAEDSLFMPSLRTADDLYTADAKAIAHAVHLGEKHPASGVHDQRDRLGSLCHLLVAEILTSIHHARDAFEQSKRIARYAKVTVEDKIKSSYYPDTYEHIMACAKLPDWSSDASSWWVMRVLPMVKEEFQKLAQDTTRNAALWNELKRVGETRKESLNDMRRSLEKSCKNKFDQFVRPQKWKTAHKSSAHGQGR